MSSISPECTSTPLVSQHARARMDMRRIKPDEISYVMDYGLCYRISGAIVYTMGRKAMTVCRKQGGATERLAGLQVICSSDNDTVITVFRNKRYRPHRDRATSASLLKKT